MDGSLEEKRIQKQPLLARTERKAAKRFEVRPSFCNARAAMKVVLDTDALKRRSAELLSGLDHLKPEEIKLMQEAGT